MNEHKSGHFLLELSLLIAEPIKMVQMKPTNHVKIFKIYKLLFKLLKYLKSSLNKMSNLLS